MFKDLMACTKYHFILLKQFWGLLSNKSDFHKTIQITDVVQAFRLVPYDDDTTTTNNNNVLIAYVQNYILAGSITPFGNLWTKHENGITINNSSVEGLAQSHTERFNLISVQVVFPWV